ncbi:response regulator [Sulfurospirillum arcachonense]|uniref:response regulator n=1 Tax=Sulfurospirillum arcachonense TaxID=57666 RepID=UPI00046953E1|nr:response regulator [Sulfurospirillum arcachonense]
MSKAKILVVEDESIVALDIKNALINLNFQVTDMVTNYDDAMQSIKKNRPDILLTDIHLENSKDGIELAKDMQKIETIPVIYLTAFADDDTIQRAIETNPVNYLHKPFKRKELKSALLLSIYKINQSSQEVISTNCKNLGFNYYFDLENNALYYNTMLIKLTQKETELLNILIQAKGTLVSIETLENMLWPENIVSNSTLRTLIYRLRTKLEYKLIETVHSTGLRLVPLY